MSVISSIKRFFHTRDELSIRNIRKESWALWLIFPLTVILSHFRHLDLNIELYGRQSLEWMLYAQGLGCLVLVFTAKKHIIPLLRIAAICSAVMLVFQLSIGAQPGFAQISKLSLYIAFHFFSGICTAGALSLFCFKLNNIERLWGIALIVLYYGLFFSINRQLPAFQAVYETWGVIILMAFYLTVVFVFDKKISKPVFNDNDIIEPIINKNESHGFRSNIKIIIALQIVYYSIMSLIHYIEAAENIVFSLPYGLGQIVSILVIVFVMLINNRNSLYIWLMFLVFTLFGLAIVNYNSTVAQFGGSLIYGLGDGLGYVIIYYLVAGVINKSKSIKTFRLYCFVLFMEYIFISMIYTKIFNHFEGSRHAIAFSVVLVLCSFCFLILPYLQKKLFAEDWTDGLYLKNMPEYTQRLAETEAVNIKEQLDLTERERELFAMLLKGMSSKDIAYTLKISIYTVYFHRSNLFRKLKVNNITELSARFNASRT